MTLQHNHLLEIINKSFSIDETVLKWLQSYLTDRNCCVIVNEAKSKQCYLTTGVSQGSILGPLLFILFTNNLDLVAERHKFSLHCYADDSQLYLKFSPTTSNSVDDLAQKVQECLFDIKKWMSERFLKLNMNKTELIEICPFQHANCFTEFPNITVGSTCIKPQRYAKCLGFYYDNKLSLSKQVTEIVNTCNFRLMNLRKIGTKFSKELKVQLTQAYVMSCLDYCNSVYYGLNSNLLSKLQSVQNKCVRFIMNLKPFSSVETHKKELHFLPVFYRIRYKIALLTFKCLDDKAPLYLQNLVTLKKTNPTYELRPEHQLCRLEVPHTKYRKSESAFMHAAPDVWNKLPYPIRSIKNADVFKKKLKTHYFRQAYA